MRLLGCLLLLQSLGFAQTRVSDCPVPRLSQLHFPWGALLASVQGVVDARFILGDDGTPRTTAFSGHPLLVQQVRSLLEKLQFTAACAGRGYRVLHRFEIRGKSGFPVRTSVTFEPPDAFVIRSNPLGLVVH